VEPVFALLTLSALPCAYSPFAHRKIADVQRVGFGTSPPLESGYVIDSMNGQIR
jgi:hypothetical protein